ncbi:MAG: hypothetical protein PVG22_07995 [Chromatiales bacterium]
MDTKNPRLLSSYDPTNDSGQGSTVSNKSVSRTLLLSALFISPALVGYTPSAFAATDCSAPSSWFPQDQTPRPNDGTFPQPIAPTLSNCVFHQWSWQMFMWLTQAWEGRPRFLGFQTPQSLLGMTQRGVMPRMGKSNDAETFDEYLQAGPDGILVDQQGNAVYYSQYVDNTFADFVTSAHLTVPNVLRNINPNTEFPIDGSNGSLELKASWKIVEEGEDTSDMFTMKTSVMKMVNCKNIITIASENCPTEDGVLTRDVTVALVGFHIGGIVKGHPEMIWATFEHKRNAPNVPANATPDTVISVQDHIFYKGGTQYRDCNLNTAPAGVMTLDESTQKLSPPTQVCRQYEHGNDTTTSDSSIKQNDLNIINLNTSVHKQMADDNIWKNYYEVGAIWFLNGSNLKPGLNLSTDKLLTGSLKLSNSTIETFTQTQSTENNCFRCHNTMQTIAEKPLVSLPATNLNISHALQNIYFWSQPTDSAQNKAKGDK